MKYRTKEQWARFFNIPVKDVTDELIKMAETTPMMPDKDFKDGEIITDSLGNKHTVKKMKL